MKYAYALAALAGVASARDISLYGGVQRREVPQEHSHNKILAAADAALKLDNPLKIQDAVFALLGNAAAAEGAPNVSNLDCLQQIVADQAFTNAKTAGNVTAQAFAIMFRALERNTGSVGLASVLCNETAKNPEIAAISQHQDPASSAASGNKQIALNVAKQLKSIGADPTLAIQTGTFAPGKLGDPTAKGNTCDVADDQEGCIISQNLLVADVTVEEITTFLASAKMIRATGTNVQTFTGSLGGPPPPVISTAGSDRPFSVDGSTFVNKGAALQRSCSVQHNACANAANSKKISGGVGQCETQESKCNAAGGAKMIRASGTNVQSFTGSLGGVAPPVISTAGSDRPFSVDGSTFVNKGAALQRSCSVQHNACADAANSKKISGGVGQCETQENECNAAAGKKRDDRLSFRAAVAAEQEERRAATKTAAGGEFGSCSNPAITFSDNNADRKGQFAFAPENTADFSHGSALNIGVISGFICGQLGSKCKASATVVAKCSAASSAASSLKSQAAADAFNKVLGV